MLLQLKGIGRLPFGRASCASYGQGQGVVRLCDYGACGNARQRVVAVTRFSVPQLRHVATTGKPTKYSCPRVKRRCMRPLRQTPSSLSQRVQRQFGYREVVGSLFPTSVQFGAAVWREGKGVGMEVLLNVEPSQ